MRWHYYPTASIADLVARSGPLLTETNWLVVCLDSDRDVIAVATRLAAVMQEQGINYRLEREGLWLPGNEVGRPFIKQRLLVPFSACYVFGLDVARCDVPTFNKTTDHGHEFAPAELDEVGTELCRLGAISYLADGCGLQYVTKDAHPIPADIEAG